MYEIIINLADFLGNLAEFIQQILFYEFTIFGLNVNMLTMLFTVGIGIWITVIIIRLIL